jgi:hypothetical protein
MTEPRPDRQYLDSWRDLRLRKRLFYLVVLGFPVLWIGLRFLVALISPPPQDIPFRADPWIPVAYIVMWIATGIYLNFYRCPRCEKLFFLGTPGVIFFKRSCVHCGLADNEKNFAKASDPNEQHVD